MKMAHIAAVLALALGASIVQAEEIQTKAGNGVILAAQNWHPNRQARGGRGCREKVAQCMQNRNHDADTCLNGYQKCRRYCGG